MAINKAKQRMLEGKPAFGAEVGLGSALSAELISPLGFDFILVDNQHGAWDDNSSMTAFRSIALGVATPMARVRKNEFGAIGRLLDRGAMGIVVPMVNSVEEAQAATEAVRYPPIGGRSGGAFGTGYLGDGYMQWANDEIFMAVQIETVRAAEVAEEILAVEGIDGCWVGPGDLSMSMGVDLSDDEGWKAHDDLIVEIFEATKRAGKIPGMGVDLSDDEGWKAHDDLRGFAYLRGSMDRQRVGGAATRRSGRAVPHDGRRRPVGGGWRAPDAR